MNDRFAQITVKTDDSMENIRTLVPSDRHLSIGRIKYGYEKRKKNY
jgi:hypothetical protein